MTARILVVDESGRFTRPIASGEMPGDGDDQPIGGTAHAGRATVPFTAFTPEDTVSVTGQTGLVAGSRIQASLVANSDEVYAQDWRAPLIRNIVPGVGFDITLRPELGSFKGAVTVDWSWI